jgi:hypothetical protein
MPRPNTNAICPRSRSARACCRSSSGPASAVASSPSAASNAATWSLASAAASASAAAADQAPKILDVPIGMTATGTRHETDSMGAIEVPADRYWALRPSGR